MVLALPDRMRGGENRFLFLSSLLLKGRMRFRYLLFGYNLSHFGNLMPE